MAVDVLEDLLLHIYRLTMQDIQCLAEVQDVDWFMRLRTLPPELAVQEIRCLLEDSSCASVFLERVFWLYCWLVSRQKIGPWLLFRFGASALQVDFNTLLGNVARAMRSLGRPVFLRVQRDCGTYYGCMISNRSDPTTRKWEVVFVVLWSNQRFAAAYAGTNEQQRTLMTCLHIALNGESVELLQGLHTDLNAAFRAACRDLAPTLHRLDRDPNIPALFFANGDLREQAEEQF